MSVGRNTATRDRHRAAIRRTQAACHICGQGIDYSLPYLDPYEFVVDHVVPRAKGGSDDITNKAAAHRKCNRDKSDKLPSDLPAPLPVLSTSRSW